MQFIFGTLCVFKGRLFRTLLCVHIKLLASIEHLSVYFRCIYYFRLNLISFSLFFFLILEILSLYLITILKLMHLICIKYRNYWELIFDFIYFYEFVDFFH